MANQVKKEWFPPRIEKGVPIPDKFDTKINFPWVRVRRWPFGKLQVGDSFPIRDENDRHSCRISAGQWRKRNPPFNFILRKDGQGVFRLWRTK